MLNQFSRTQRLIGRDGIERLSKTRVAVFGLGGVGGYVCEALVRSGVGSFDLIDNDTISLTNLNRQIIATHETLGRYKTEVMKERMLSINPDVKVQLHSSFFLPENAGEYPFEEYDYIVDAVDTVTAKIGIIMKAKELGIPVISSMGTGNKMDPGRLQITDIYKTSVCPLAKVMRDEMKKRNVKRLKVVFSDETPVRPFPDDYGNSGLNGDVEGYTEPLPPGKRALPGSNAFVPSAAGLMIAAEVVRDLMKHPVPNSR